MLDADAVINNSSHKAGGSREKVRAGPAGRARVVEFSLNLDRPTRLSFPLHINDC